MQLQGLSAMDFTFFRILDAMTMHRAKKLSALIGWL